MASFSTRHLFFSTLFLSTLLSMQIHARESQFFSKFTRTNPQETNPHVQIPNFVPETTQETTKFPNKEQTQDQDPSFVSESENGYGLYGHDSVSNNNNNKEVVAYEPYNTPSPTQTRESYDYGKVAKNNYDEQNNNNNNNKENVVDEPYTTPSLTQTQDSYNYEKYTKNNYDEQNNEKYYNNDNYNSKKGKSNENYYNSYNYNDVERQGMSDTRFVENGKYFYDVNNEEKNNNYYPNQYNYQTRTSRNYDQYQTNGGNYYGSNNVQGYENNQQEEFVNEQEEQFTP